MNTVHHLCLSSSPLDAKEYNRRFNVASKQSIMPQDAKDNYAYDWTKYKKSTGPTFDRNEMVQNVTVEKGQTAYLPCVILNQEHFTISWLRKNRHMNIITVGEHRFIQDERYSLPHYKGPSDWTLKIANVKLADGGIYECQIGTTPKTGRNISLFIADSRRWRA
ncbi:hypothetical protein RvY_08200-3 [Ramazzottius varieornatus]|uniref:Ig-like domain-containing protein n=1 Tax=Ramazzottius varieornatus TaxID=947166 RepID=A0A1D1V513_RAMVA|nr:hypothetical protein RvY_08200-3 [Ramazzottius varieornatus]